jgi:hypothetical protein
VERYDVAYTPSWLALGGRHQRQQSQLWLLWMWCFLKWAAKVSGRWNLVMHMGDSGWAIH